MPNCFIVGKLRQIFGMAELGFSEYNQVLYGLLDRIRLKMSLLYWPFIAICISSAVCISFSRSALLSFRSFSYSSLFTLTGTLSRYDLHFLDCVSSYFDWERIFQDI